MLAMPSTALSQIHSFSSIHRRTTKLNLSLRKPFVVATPNCRSKFSVCMHLEGSGTEISSSDSKPTTIYATDASKSTNVSGTGNSYPVTEEVAGKLEIDAKVNEQGATSTPKRAAKIHDFCFGIPFGGLVFSGGVLGFLFSRNTTTLSTGILYGSGLLALSVFSLKTWRQGKSSLPFILGQAALSAALLWKHFENYTLTKKLFPTGFYAFISAAMLCFYAYVMLSGGNPPPKKLKLATSPAS